MALQLSHLSVIVNQDGAAILDSNAGRITTLNPTGAYVWQALERGEDRETIAKGLAQASGEAIEAVREDLAGFMGALKRQGLLTE